MSDEIRKYLTDIQFAIAEIESFVGEKKSFNRFRKSALIRAAVERKIEIIGEAMNNLLQLDGDLPISNARPLAQRLQALCLLFQSAVPTNQNFKPQ